MREAERDDCFKWQAENCGFHLSVVVTDHFNIIGSYWVMFSEGYFSHST
jgi:hypothetical protein